MTDKVALIGSGNWGSAIAKIVGMNVMKHDCFDKQVRMWVYEEIINGEKLTDIINTKHENAKYLPGILLPTNIVAIADVLETCKDATILVFVIPHQFVKGICDQLKGKLKPNTKAISLIKGVDVGAGGLNLISRNIETALNVNTSVLMGANIANEVAQEKFCETTIGYKVREEGEMFYKLFNSKWFKVSIVDDVVGVELCGALKNVVAIAAGLVDGLKMGDNTKAAIIRIGLMEMKKFSKTFFDGVKDATFSESCGVADLITTCYGGRNRKVAEARVLTGKSFDELEKEMLSGQKLQGTLTSKEVFEILQQKQLTNQFPLFVTVYRICYENVPPFAIVHFEDSEDQL